ncbi:hypothetical protein BDR04DRAFT_838101 [Suillus decipiens]|nr:hypothetical protein BDR04DRAFT_838101 [Suillus decipiens]
MDQLVSFEALLFPSDGCKSHMVALMSIPMLVPDPHAPYSALPAWMSYSEVYMDYITKGLGPQAWHYHLVEALDCMKKKFANPYVIFYLTVSRDGMSFPINKCIREIQRQSFREATAWHRNIIITKYQESPFLLMINGSIADFPILRNYFMMHNAPQS